MKSPIQTSAPHCVLEAKHLGKSYSSPDGSFLKVFDDINFQILVGEKISLMGPSGSGKTTFMSILAGLDEPTRGEVLIDGKNLFALSPDERLKYRAEKIGIIFQQFHLMPFLNAIENVSLPLELKNEPTFKAQSEEALRKVGLWERRHHLPHQMSRGECQRVAVARVLATKPSLILADEPTGSLDKKNAEHVMELILGLINEIPDSSLLFVTHDPHLAQSCEKRYYIESGNLQLL